LAGDPGYTPILVVRQAAGLSQNRA